MFATPTTFAAISGNAADGMGWLCAIAALVVTAVWMLLVLLCLRDIEANTRRSGRRD